MSSGYGFLPIHTPPDTTSPVSPETIFTKFLVVIVVLTLAVVALKVFIIYKCLKYGDSGMSIIDRFIGGAPQPSPTIPVSQPSPIIPDSQPFPRIPDSHIRMTTVENFLNDIAREKPISFSPQQLQGFTHNYPTALGSGGFGTVYKGELPNGMPVAVKVLTGELNKTVEEQFMAEVGTIGRTNHLNLVKLYGFCFNATLRALVYEYMENGSLDSYLFHREREIEWGKLHEIAIGTAKGIRYLHEECQQRIIHYDIKPANILLDADFTPKIADFGLAKLLSRRNTQVSMPRGRGTPGYAAPEIWEPFPVTEKCDVYSFGMLLFEIVGRRRNFDSRCRSESQDWFPNWVWERVENAQLGVVASVCGIGEEHREKAERTCKVALWCVQKQPQARPSMSTVVKMLEGEMEIAPPLNPFQHLLTSGPAIPINPIWSGSSTGSTTNAAGTSGSRDEEDVTRSLIREHEIEMKTLYYGIS